MGDEAAGALGRISQFVKAPPAAVYAAFMDPAALVQWLPPARMTGTIHAFDARVGGGYAMSLFYPEDERAFRGKTALREDRVEVRFTALEPPHRIVEAVRFVTDDPALMGEMTITITLEDAPGGTLVAMAFENLPRGLRPEDNAEGGRLSLEQLARRFA
jgi:uncharacterized protein YndB with AHSA1/START domain